MDSCYFNSDFEDYLSSNKIDYNINMNSRSNQEFEYLLHFIFDEPILTLKEYSQVYIDHIESLSKKEFRTTLHGQNVRLLNDSSLDKKTEKVLNSKFTAAEFGIKNNFCHPETKIVSNPKNYKENYLCKKEFSSSGRGFSVNPDDSWFLKTDKFIMEPKLDRVKDFSSLLINNLTYNYENIVDEYFQYKGTILRQNNFIENESYTDAIVSIRDHYKNLDAKEVFSIDSFTYKENGIEKYYILSEVNHRKSFGWIGYKLKDHLTKDGYLMLRLISQKDLKKFNSYNDFIQKFPKNATPLSPLGNRFMVVCIYADSEDKMNECYKDLKSQIVV